MSVVVVDIDGTIADCTERASKYLEGDKKDWDAFYSHCRDDKPIKNVISIVRHLNEKNAILFISGRRESCRKDTDEWLQRELHFPCDKSYLLYLRPENETRHDIVVKPELLEKAILENEIDRDNIICFLEDRNSMVKRWRELGYTCLQVAEGDF